MADSTTSHKSGDNTPAFISSVSTKLVDTTWAEITDEFAVHANFHDRPRMTREELSFHSDVKLLGHLCLDLQSVSGDILEIGVWKGKSLALMQRLSKNAKIIGIDPLEIDLQREELNFFRERIFDETEIIENYSEMAVDEVLEITKNLKLLHIDGGHTARNVVLDFLLYSPFIVPGGYLVFDDYADFEFCPEVGPTIDMLIEFGFTNQFKAIGQVTGFENSFLLQKI